MHMHMHTHMHALSLSLSLFHARAWMCGCVNILMQRHVSIRHGNLKCSKVLASNTNKIFYKIFSKFKSEKRKNMYINNNIKIIYDF